MGLIVNEGNAGLNTLAGLAVELLDGHELPEDLYVYGLEDRDGAEFWIDSNVPNAEAVKRTLERLSGRRCRVGLPTEPRRRPALGIVRRMRDQENIAISTKVAVYVLFALNGKVNFTEADLQELFQVLPDVFRTHWRPKIGDIVIWEGSTMLYCVRRVADTGEVYLHDAETEEEFGWYNNATVRPVLASVGQTARVGINYQLAGNSYTTALWGRMESAANMRVSPECVEAGARVGRLIPVIPDRIIRINR